MNENDSLKSLVCEWSIFQNFPEFEPKLAQILKIRKIGISGDFAQNFTKNWSYMNGSLFSWKIGICRGLYFQIPWRHVPTKTKLEYRPPPQAEGNPIFFDEMFLLQPPGALT